VLLVSVGLVPAWRTARRVVDRGLWRPSAVAELLARRSFPPSAVAGLRMALERGPGRSAIPIRSTIVGIALAAVTISAVVSFGASLDHLTGTPRLYGWGWDVSAGNPYADDLTGLVLPVLQSDRDVVAYSGAASSSSRAPSGHQPSPAERPQPPTRLPSGREHFVASAVLSVRPSR